MAGGVTIANAADADAKNMFCFLECNGIEGNVNGGFGVGVKGLPSALTMSPTATLDLMGAAYVSGEYSGGQGNRRRRGGRRQTAGKRKREAGIVSAFGYEWYEV